MRHVTVRKPQAIPAVSVLTLALGTAAFVAIGALAIGRLTIKTARFNALEVDELTVRKLRVLEDRGPSPVAE